MQTVAHCSGSAKDPHAGWMRRIEELWRRLDEDECSQEQATDIVVEYEEKLDLIAGTPTRTPQGIAAQIEVVLHTIESGFTPGGAEKVALRNAVAALKRAGRARGQPGAGGKARSGERREHRGDHPPARGTAPAAGRDGRDRPLDGSPG
jgi:hypothetical protein